MSKITEGEVHEALKIAGSGKSPGHDGQSYELYLRLSPMFVLMLTVVFNNWFRQGSVPDRISRGAITLLKDKYGEWELGNYRLITAKHGIKDFDQDLGHAFAFICRNSVETGADLRCEHSNG